MTAPHVAGDQPRSFLAVYLRDHLAGAAAGVSLVGRSKRANIGTELGDFLTKMESEIIADRRSLTAMMARLGVSKSRVKELLGAAAEMLGRLKSNGRVFQYSPLSRVVELEALAAGVLTKRSLWLSLRAVVDDYDELDPRELDGLAARATKQYEELLVEHDRAASAAFAARAVSKI